MKQIIPFFLLIALVLHPIANFAQQVEPHIVFETKMHDFGEIKEADGPVTYQFEFKNTGSSPVNIQNVRASCGCTSPSWTKEPVLPGTTGYVSATYNPANRPGSFNKTITVNTDASQSPIVLTIRGKVIPKPRSIEDEYPFQFGQIRMKRNHLAFPRIKNTETKTMTIDVVNDSDTDAAITFSRVPEHITCEAEPATLKPHQTGVISIEYNAKKANDWDYVIDRMYLLVNGEQVNNQRISVSATIEEDFSKLSAKDLENAPKIEFSEGLTFEFDTLEQGEKVSHEFVFTNEGESDLVIRKIRSSCGCTAVMSDQEVIAPGEEAHISTTFNSTGKKGPVRKTVTVITNDPNQSRVILWIKGYVKLPEEE